jgi:hypothetical protein
MQGEVVVQIVWIAATTLTNPEPKAQVRDPFTRHRRSANWLGPRSQGGDTVRSQVARGNVTQEVAVNGG